jgi:hypothetical protein
MARRSNRSKASRRDPEEYRVPALGTHWRVDGAPKTAYATQRDAYAAAEERRQESGADLNVYRCTFCDSWHMGNSSRRGE